MKNEKAKTILIIVLIILVLACVGYIAYPYVIKKDDEKINLYNELEKDEVKKSEIEVETIDTNLSFLQLENQKENKIYSPLSIKYALKMLEAGASGDSKLQISQAIGNFELTKYKSNKNMSLANALFVRDSYKDSVKNDYINTLKTNYDAEVMFDSFKTPDKINSWVSNKTLKLIPSIVNNIDSNINFMLVNALGIDMEWKNKFLVMGEGENSYRCSHENFGYSTFSELSSRKFDGETQEVSGMKIDAAVNNYDIVKELGEENIKATVGTEYRKWAKNLTKDDWEYDEKFGGDLSDTNIEKNLNEFLYGTSEEDVGYIAELKENYKQTDYSTDFSIYVDENVKVFAKDLKEYDGTTLQYVGIMPVTESLDSYIKNTNETKVMALVNKLKEIKSENFKDGVATQITGYIPKFKFEYDLKLKDDLNRLGITNVFEPEKASLTEISNQKDQYIGEAIHKANIEFTEDGIKAAAATMLGGMRSRKFF